MDNNSKIQLPTSKFLRILLIEDNPGDARLFQEILKEVRGDFTVSVAEKLGLGLKLLLSENIDVVLLDLNLPDSSGLATLTGLQARFPHLPIVIMTSIDDEELAHQAVRLGAQDYLVKGNVNGELLRRTLVYAVERKQTEEALRKSHDELEVRVDARTEELKAAEKALKDINETLEQRVAERTSELQTANASLRDSRLATLNMMEDALAARKQAEEANAELRQEVTERKQAEEALHESEEGLKRAQEISHLGSWDLDLVSNTLTWSDEVYRIFGLQPQEFGATYAAFLEAVHPDDRTAVNEAYSGSMREGKDTYEIEHRIVRKATGEIRYVHEKSQHFRDKAGRIIRSAGMVHDVTERRKAEADVLQLSEDMAERNMELESLNKELEAFVYSVSHDLRAPLRTISSFAEFLVEDYTDRLDDQGRDYLARINKGAARMSRLIADLLYLSKISRQDLNRTKIDMSKSALSVIADLRERDPSRSVEVNIAGDVFAFADPRLMEIALANLLGNAWKFTLKTEDARIEFGTVENPPPPPPREATVYYIKDNGAGFNPEYAEKMFLPFQRLHSNEEFEGTGIGLTIVERIVRRHGGKIWAEGETGKGTSVFFTLG